MRDFRTNRRTRKTFPIETIVTSGGDTIRIMPPPGTKVEYGVSKLSEVRPPYSVFVIRSDDGWWNNDDGWVENKSDATVFDDEQHLTFNKPIGQDVRWMLLQYKRSK